MGISLIIALKLERNLEKVGKLASQYSDDIKHQSAMTASLVEPFIILFLGAFVGNIRIASYLPLFQMGQSLGNSIVMPLLSVC